MADLNMAVVVYTSDVTWVFYSLNSAPACNHLRNMLLILRYNECMKRMCRFCHYFFTINTTCKCHVLDSMIYGVVIYISELLQNTLCNLCFFIFTNFHVLRNIVKVDVFSLKYCFAFMS